MLASSRSFSDEALNYELQNPPDEQQICIPKNVKSWAKVSYMRRWWRNGRQRRSLSWIVLGFCRVRQVTTLDNTRVFELQRQFPLSICVIRHIQIPIARPPSSPSSCLQSLHKNQTLTSPFFVFQIRREVVCHENRWRWYGGAPPKMKAPPRWWWPEKKKWKFCQDGGGPTSIDSPIGDGERIQCGQFVYENPKFSNPTLMVDSNVYNS